MTAILAGRANNSVRVMQVAGTAKDWRVVQGLSGYLIKDQHLVQGGSRIRSQGSWTKKSKGDCGAKIR